MSEAPKTIAFYSKTDAWFELSNVYPQGFEEDGIYWPSVEHYFQAMKFPGAENADLRERIRGARDVRRAKDLGRTREVAIRDDWDAVRDDVMLHAIRRKFAHPRLREILLSTGNATLVENSPSDFYWGCGRTGHGENRLGKILMKVRDEMRP